MGKRIGGILGRSKIESISRRLRTLKTFSVNDTWHKLNQCEVLLLSHENDRPYSFQGKRYSHLIDSVRFYLETNKVSCESMSLPFDSQKYSTNYYSDKTVNRLFLKQDVINFIRPLFFLKRFSSQEMHFRYVNNWLKILSLCNPKVVIAIQPSESLCEACHKKGIRVYDFQHGAIHESISSYGAGFNLNKSVKRKPTGYLCWDEVSADVLRQWCVVNKLDVFVLGNPWIYRFFKKDKKDGVVQSELLQKLPFNINQKSILVTLQWDLDYWHPDFFDSGEIVHPVLLDIINNPEKKINWLLRLHPVQIADKRLVSSIKNQFKGVDNVFIDWPTSTPLPVALSYVQGHITWSSSVVIEASLFGIKNYVLSPVGLFSAMRSPRQHQIEKKHERPFLFEEDKGLVERSKGQPNKNNILKWIEGLQYQGIVTYERHNLFDINGLVSIIKE